jgi:hypothetical protein
MELWTESSLQELYQSAVDAFPNTAMRQHAVDPIVISSLQWVPFLGMKTLFVKGLAESGSKEYSPVIVFKRVRYGDSEGPRIVPLAASDGKDYFLERLSAEDTDVLVRCNCQDFYWRFNYFNHLDKSLQGRKRKKYEAIYNPGSANPQAQPGLCKHLMKMAAVLRESGVM